MIFLNEACRAALDDWLEDFLPLGPHLPRDISVVRHSMTQALTENQIFQEIMGEGRFQNLAARLKKNEEEQ